MLQLLETLPGNAAGKGSNGLGVIAIATPGAVLFPGFN